MVKKYTLLITKHKNRIFQIKWLLNPSRVYALTVADQGFPVGGVDLRHGWFSVKMHGKTKELGQVGGRVPGTPHRSANASASLLQ